MSARYYDPGTGRFLSEDPIVFGSGDTNNYRYVFNQSISITDPSGKVAPVVIGAVFGGILGGVSSGYLASLDPCSSFSSIALSGLIGAGTGAIGGAIAVIGGLGSSVAFDSTAGLAAVGGESSLAASLFGDAVSISGTISTAFGLNSNSCGCSGR